MRMGGWEGDEVGSRGVRIKIGVSDNGDFARTCSVMFALICSSLSLIRQMRASHRNTLTV